VQQPWLSFGNEPPRRQERKGSHDSWRLGENKCEDSGINQLLKRLRKRAGLTGCSNPHAFRHGFAKDYLMNNGDLASLADLMGHESVETTKTFYAIFEQDDLRRKHDQFSAARWQ
jgi:site-specific recombinase XerD